MPSSSPMIPENVQGSPGWIMMQGALQAAKVKTASWQNLLAVHTSSCCAPNKAERMVESLEEAGLRTRFTDPGTGRIAVRMIIPNLFPGFPYGIASDWHDDHRSAKEEVCFDTLTFMLLLAPHMVWMHPNSVNEGQEAIDQLRAKGGCMQMVGKLGQWQETLRWQAAAPVLVPKSSPSSGGTAASSGAAATSSSAGNEENEKQAEALLIKGVSKGQWQHPSNIQSRTVYLGLADLLPKRTLRRFLEARPQLFEVRDTGIGKNWEFRIK